MNIEQIFEEWDKDSKLDRNRLDEESLNIPKLHNKYYKIYIAEKARLIKMESEYKILYKDRYDFYIGSIDDDTLAKYKWTEEFKEFSRKKILKSEIDRYLDADENIINISLKIGLQKEKVGLIDSIIKSLRDRGFNIKNSIDFIRFQSGA